MMPDSPAAKLDAVDHTETSLAAIVAAIEQTTVLTDRGLLHILKRHPSRDGLYGKRAIIAAFRRLARAGRTRESEPSFVAKVRVKPIRSLSGVTPLTLLTKPFPCPGRCVFCPSDISMPKSYLRDEPGAQRAYLNGFDPYRQSFNRLAAFSGGGHPVDKVEVLVLGGTWSSYPEPYQRWFIKRSLDALNEFDKDAPPLPAVARASPPPANAPWTPGRRYNELVGIGLGESPRQGASSDNDLATDLQEATWEELACAQRRNEEAASRSVGLVLETRPELVSDAEVVRLRRLGATKIQIGIQAVDDRLLQLNQRGHDVAATRTAFGRLRRAGFKLLGHWMPNLLGATPESDRADFERLFDDPQLRPDELKIYPTSLIETAELMDHHRAGRWRPYTDAELCDLLADCLARVPAWCRVSRVIRDIPATDIVTGNHTANLREVVEARLVAEGRPARDIRSREIRGHDFDPRQLRERPLAYPTADGHGRGEERFVQLVTPGDRIAAFLRLSLPRSPSPIDELADVAIVRELHVYGATLGLGARSAAAAQHRGLGQRLLERAAQLAREAGYRRLAVISAIGTRRYYRRHGYVDGDLYQSRSLD